MTRRMERLNKLFRMEISDLILRQVRDPRLGGLISVVSVSTSPDLKFARVFVSIMGDAEEKKTVQKGLASASPFLRAELSRRLSLRHIPELVFQLDKSIEIGASVLDLMDKLRDEGSSLGAGEQDDS